MALKRCSKCNKILTTEECNKRFDYCYTCYKSRSSSSSRYFKGSTVGLKRCLLCNEILTTEEYNQGYDYHLGCYLKIKGKNKY